MGFNTTVVILNDMLGEIERDPEFGKKLVAAIRSFDRTRPERMPYVTGQTQVIGHHHADGMMVFAVGGNTGREIGYGGNYRADNDDIIKELERQRKQRVKDAKKETILVDKSAI